jgi:hypothetical protein
VARCDLCGRATPRAGVHRVHGAEPWYDPTAWLRNGFGRQPTVQSFQGFERYLCRVCEPKVMEVAKLYIANRLLREQLWHLRFVISARSPKRKGRDGYYELDEDSVRRIWQQVAGGT